MYEKRFRYKGQNIVIKCDNKKILRYGYQRFTHYYLDIRGFTSKNKSFLEAMNPIKHEEHWSDLVKKMCLNSSVVDVGPMAAVSGTLSECCANDMFDKGANTVLFEYGGDMYVYTNKGVSFIVHTGGVLDFKIEVGPESAPIAICSSSAVIGKNQSLGKCNLAMVFSKNAGLADSAATACADKVKSEKDIWPVLKWVEKIQGIDGAFIVKGEIFGMAGDIPSITQVNSELEHDGKITKDGFYDL